MALFFFNLILARERIEDDEGMDLPDLDAAKEEAKAAAREIVVDWLRSGREIAGEVEIADADSKPLLRIPFHGTIIA